MASNEQQQQFLEFLESLFAQKNNDIIARWENFKSHLDANKTNWNGEQYFYFEKRVADVDNAVAAMKNNVEQRVMPFLDHKKRSLEQHRQ